MTLASFLLGGSYLDIYQMHGVTKQSFYQIIWKVCDAIKAEFPVDHPYDDANKMSQVAAGFGATSNDCMHGCVGALDGIAIKIHRPSKRYSKKAKSFYNRKHFYAINMQVLA